MSCTAGGNRMVNSHCDFGTAWKEKDFGPSGGKKLGGKSSGGKKGGFYW